MPESASEARTLVGDCPHIAPTHVNFVFFDIKPVTLR